MHILFNSNVLYFEDNKEKRGIDFVGSTGNTNEFSSGGFSCYDSTDISGKSYCRYYD